MKKLLLLILLFLFISKTNAEESIPISLSGDYLEYITSQELIIGKGNVILEQGEKKIIADGIEYYINSENLTATGNVIFTEKDKIYKGDKIIFNVKTGIGTMEQSNVYTNPWYFRTAKFEKISEKIIQSYDTITMTTCDLPKPHYKFQAKKMKIFLDDKIIAYNVFFYVGNVPILYLPIYYYSLKYSHFYIRPGFSTKYGWWLNTKLHFTSLPYSYGSYVLDWWQKRGIGKGLEYNYYVNDNKRGAFNFYAIEQKPLYQDSTANRFYNPSGVDPIKRWKSQIYINQQLTPTITAKLNYERLSDPDFKVEYENISERVITQDINFTLLKTADTYTLSLFWQEINIWNEANKKYEEDNKTLPEIKLDFLKKPIGSILDQQIYYKVDLSYAHRFIKTYNNLITPEIKGSDYYFDKAALSQSLMTSFNIFPRNSLSPTIRYIQDWYSDHDPINLKDRNFGVFETELKLNSNITRNVSNELTHGYSRQLDELKGTAYLDYNGIAKNELAEILRLENSKQNARINIETSYDLRKKFDEEIKNYKTKFRDLKTLLYYEPIQNYKIESNLYWDIYADENDPYFPKFQSLHKEQFKLNDTSVEILHQFDPKTKLVLKSKYYHIYIDELYGPLIINSYSTVEGKLEFQLTNKWTINFINILRNNKIYEKFRFRDFLIEEQNIELIRDLHCWEAGFIIKSKYDYDLDNSFQELWFILTLKAFPDDEGLKLKEMSSSPYSTYYNF